MPVTVPRWMVIWSLVSAALNLTDFAYLWLRPRTLPGGDLHWLSHPYDTYTAYDPSYKDVHHTFSAAQSYINCIEVAVQVFAVLMLATPVRQTVWPALLLLIGHSATLFKTILYLIITAMESRWSKAQFSLTQLDTWTVGYVGVFVAPLLLWIIFPALIIATIAQKIAASDRQLAIKGRKAH